jgi:hypothetical protein
MSAEVPCIGELSISVIFGASGHILLQKKGLKLGKNVGSVYIGQFIHNIPTGLFDFITIKYPLVKFEGIIFNGSHHDYPDLFLGHLITCVLLQAQDGQLFDRFNFHAITWPERIRT